MTFDFSTLRRSLHQKMSSSEREKTEVEFTRKINALVSEIERVAPNFKTLDQYEALLEKDRAASREWEVARDEHIKLTTKYEEVKGMRKDSFMKAFEQISDNIDKTYNELTKSNTYAVGGMSNTHDVAGTACLNLENSDEPYLGGINFSVVPPRKRYRDISQLSGGEKTVAAIALLFSIHSFRPSPFFILDEVDAALDNSNVAKVASFIRAGSWFQIIVILLKDNFYDKAEALVSVYRDSDKGCSRTLTFDLTKCGES